MSMTKYSKFLSEKWKNFSEEAKVELQRQYQIKRDQKLRRDEIADQCIANHERRNKYKRRLQKNVTEQIEISLNNHVLSNQSETNQLQRAWLDSRLYFHRKFF
ncbi:6242_t:CDS:1 [Funneliformis geosporum]|uniref:6242_t:CDS:1 n=1 Tax=Funneliformis geosporum TaxID=1117311 RepID=A0A9W4X549_9GLOM|nr:6242_t:CDS:1 [Funneliformis geosporum]